MGFELLFCASVNTKLSYEALLMY